MPSTDPRWIPETETAVAVFLTSWYADARSFDTTAESGAARLLGLLADIGVLRPLLKKIDLDEFYCAACRGPCRDESDLDDDDLEEVEIVGPPDMREPACVANWPECYSGGYDPRCCRFPKSCSVRTIGEPRFHGHFPEICDVPECDAFGFSHP